MTATNFMVLLYGVFPFFFFFFFFFFGGGGGFAGRLLDQGGILEGNLNTNFTPLLATRPLFQSGCLLIPPFLVRFGGICR